MSFFRLQPFSFLFGGCFFFFSPLFLPLLYRPLHKQPPIVETRVSTNGCDLVVVLSSCCLQKHHWFPPQEKSNVDTKKWRSIFFFSSGVKHNDPQGVYTCPVAPFTRNENLFCDRHYGYGLRFWLDLLSCYGVVTPWHVFPRHNAALAHSLRSCDATLSRFVWTQSSDPTKSRRLNSQRLHPRLPLSFTSSTPPFDHDHCSFPHIVKA